MQFGIFKHNRNVAKGQYLDKESVQLRHRLAVRIFKDFSTGYLQMTIGCNDNIASKDADGKVHYINSIKLLYDCDYPLVILDAEAILTQYEAEEKFSLKHPRFCDSRIQEALNIQLTQEEKNQAVVVRDGVTYLVIGNGTSFLDSIHYEDGWLPPKSNE